MVQANAPLLSKGVFGGYNSPSQLFFFGIILSFIPLLIAILLQFDYSLSLTISIGLLLFGAVFAINSSLHSYLIIKYADSDGVSLDVGFYYMANAMGRLIGTILSGVIFQVVGFYMCLIFSSLLLFISVYISRKLKVMA